MKKELTEVRMGHFAKGWARMVVKPMVEDHTLSRRMRFRRHSIWKYAFRRSIRLASPSGQQERAVCVAEAVLNTIVSLVPKRLSDEEIGDAIEFIRQRVQMGRPVWWVYVKVISTIFWVLINAVREVSAAFLGKTKKMG